jgi:drug/metabolite transporter (DMT)-like permease
MSTRSRAVGYLLVAVAAMSWGTWPKILKLAESYGPLDARLQSAVVLATLTVVSAPLCFVDRVRVRATRRAWAGVAWLGVADALNVLLFFGAYRTTTVGIAVTTHYLTPLFVALAAPLVLAGKEDAESRMRTYGAAALSFAGLLLLLRPWEGSLGGRDGVGALLGAGSAVFYASNVLVNKRLTGVFSGSELMAYHGVVSTAVLVALVPPASWAAVTLPSFLVLLGGALGPGALAGLFFVWGLRRVPAAHASTLTLLEPLVAVVLAITTMGEPWNAATAVGGTAILLGAFLVVTGGRKLG